MVRPVLIKIPVHPYIKNDHVIWLHGHGSSDWDVLCAYCKRFLDYEYIEDMLEDEDGNLYGTVFTALNEKEEADLMEYLEENRCRYGIEYVSGTKGKMTLEEYVEKESE